MARMRRHCTACWSSPCRRPPRCRQARWRSPAAALARAGGPLVGGDVPAARRMIKLIVAKRCVATAVRKAAHPLLDASCERLVGAIHFGGWHLQLPCAAYMLHTAAAVHAAAVDARVERVCMRHPNACDDVLTQGWHTTFDACCGCVVW